MLKNDNWIAEQAAQGMISPFKSSMVRRVGDHRVISYGLGSYGYDIRLSPKDFRVFRRVAGAVVDPKDFDARSLEQAELCRDEHGEFFIVPGHSYGLGVALERLVVPHNVSVLCLGKSTYARAGLIANITPAEAGWAGHLTLEFSNSSPADMRLYAGEGVVQLLFFEGEPCNVPYGDRAGGGKYRGQGEFVVLPRV